ncbi:MAG TPA: hypothetical protein VFZ83_15645 [Acidimicrobiia bacterium]|nr:hypothetical protein [Acidimicrobiia bacterium]
MLCGIVRDEVQHRHGRAMVLQLEAHRGVPETRAYVEAMLGLQVWSHKLYKQAVGDAHAARASA